MDDLDGIKGTSQGLRKTDRPDLERLKEAHSDFIDSPPRRDTFRILDGNKSNFKRKLGRLGRFFYRKNKSIQAKTELYEIENIHMDGDKNTIYLRPALRDKFNITVDADRQHIKSFNPAKVITVNYPDGHEGKAVLTTPLIHENILVPKVTPENPDILITAYELELGRVRLIQDDGTRTELYVDDRQVKLMALIGIACTLGGAALGGLTVFWLRYIGVI